MEIFVPASEDHGKLSLTQFSDERTTTFVHAETVRCDLRHLSENEIGQFPRPPLSVEVERRTAGRGCCGRNSDEMVTRDRRKESGNGGVDVRLCRLLATFLFLPSFARLLSSLCCLWSPPLLVFLQTLAALAASLLKFHRRPIQAAILKSCKAAALRPPFIQFFGCQALA